MTFKCSCGPAIRCKYPNCKEGLDWKEPELAKPEPTFGLMTPEAQEREASLQDTAPRWHSEGGVQEALDGLIESARLLGATQALKGFGRYTEKDARFERAQYEAISKYKGVVCAELAKPEQPDTWLQQALKQTYEYGKADGLKQRHPEEEVQRLTRLAMDACIAGSKGKYPSALALSKHEDAVREVLGVPAPKGNQHG